MAPVKTNIVRLAEQADAASVANENAASGAELSFRAGEDHFERLTALAADIFDMPIAGIAVAEGGGLCFKGAVGVDATVLPPLSDLIARVLRNDEIVLSAPGGEAGATADLGFFVGLPLHDSGHAFHSQTLYQNRRDHYDDGRDHRMGTKWLAILSYDR